MTLLLMLALSAAPPSSAPAAAPADLVRYRQSMMKALASHLGALKLITEGKVPFDKHAAAHARNVAELSAGMVELFPAGTGPDKVPSEALEEIWTDSATVSAKFSAAAENMRATGEKIGKAAANAEALKAEVKAASDSCASCHRKFRKMK